MPMTPGTIVNVVLLVAVLTIISACSYGHKKFDVPAEDDKPYKLRVVQSDDFGSLWDTDAAVNALSLVESESKKGDTVVLLFIHGWHHNADGGDENLTNFAKTLETLSAVFDAKYTKAEDKISVVGIYVGWRGRSLPGLLDYATIWGRKPAAERVGEGDLSEFIARLQKIYEARTSVKAQNFMGMVLTGHSLGAQVLFKAVAPTLERSLIQSTTPFAGTGIVDRQKALLAPALPPVSGVGDIVLLLNPALEAYQFQRFHRLYRSRTYESSQLPIMFVVSSENDNANGVAFPLSRAFSLPFRPLFRSDEQAALFSSALGKYVPQQTHRLEPLPAGAKPNLCQDGDVDCLNAEDLSGTVRTVSAQLRPLDGVVSIRYSPVIVANTSKDLVDGHNQIYIPSFVSFVSDYVAEIEFKKIASFREDKKQSLLKAAAKKGTPQADTPQ